MKQTAVEWLWDMLLKGEFINDPEELLRQAKVMEKKQIIQAFKEGIAYWNGDEWKLIDVEAYYNNLIENL